MLSLSLGSLRVRLMLLILIAVVPMSMLILIAGQEDRRVAAIDVQRDAMRMARVVTGDHERFVEGVHQLLIGLGQLTEVKDRDTAACDKIFAELLQKYSYYNDLGAVDSDGVVFCSAHPMTKPVVAADRPWFKHAVETGGFAVGEYQIGRITEKAGLAFGYPVKGDDGRVRAVVFAILDLAWFNHVAVRADLPPGASLSVRDRNGTILSRYPDPGKWVGKTAPEASIVKEILDQRGEGTAEATGIDGIRRLYAFMPLSGTQDTGLYLSIGMPVEIAYAGVERIVSRNLIGLGLVGVMALLAAWSFGNLFFVRQVNALLAVTKRLAAGDLSARTAMSSGQGELSQLASGFDEMAESVERLTGELRQVEKKYRTLVEQLPAVIYTTSVGEESRITYISPQVENMLGFAPDEWMTDRHLWASRLCPEDFERVTKQLLNSRITGEPFRSEYRMVARDGRIVCIRDESLGLKDESGNSIIGIQGIMRDITERKEAETALRDSETKFRLLLEMAPTAIVIHAGRKFLYVNAAAETISGYTKEELLGKEFCELVCPDFQGKIKSKSLAILRGEAASSRYEMKIATKNRGERWVDVTAHAMEFEGNLAILGAAFDITERKRAENAVRDLSRKNELILNSVDQGILGLNLEANISFINTAALAMTGWKAEELLGKNAHDALHYSRADGTAYHKEKCPNVVALQTGTAHHVDNDTYWKKDGTSFPVEYASTPMRDEEGRLVGAVATFKDISDRKNAEEERLRLVTAIEQAAESVAISDTQGIIQYVNPAFQRISGYSREEIVGSHPRILKSKNHNESFYRTVRNTVAGGDVWRGHMTYKNKNCSLYEVETTISPVRDSSGAIINHVVVQRDVTHEAQTERRLRRAQKMEAIGTLAGGIAHDFNNILSAILGYTDLSLDSLPEDSAVRGYLKQIMKSGGRAKDLVKQILTFSRQTEEERKPVMVSLLVKEALKLLRASLPSTIEIGQNIAIKSDNDTVLADPTQIHHVLMNLCTNAAHAMKEKGGRLQVSLIDVDIDVEFASRHAEIHPGPYLMLTVSDTGIGMDVLVRERIFDPFYTTKEPGEGTGMGLAVAHGIVKQCGGMIKVNSAPGIGSSFHVFLPRHGSKGDAHAHEPISNLRGSERILFVDDEEALANLAQTGLTRLGYHVVVRTSSIEALEAFRSNPDGFDLVITDYTMPNMTGEIFAQEILKSRPDIPIILCTGFSALISPESAKAMKFRGFLMKPVIIREMAQSIREILGEPQPSYLNEVLGLDLLAVKGAGWASFKRGSL